MSDYDENMKIVLFQNDKQGNDKAPVMRGKVTVNNVEYEVSLWSRTSKAGNRFWSGEIRDKDAWKSRQGTLDDAPPTKASDEDDIPF